MGKQLFIAEKPSVAQEFAKTLGLGSGRRDGYLETEQYIVTWCFGHLVTMSYPEVYDPRMKKWSLDTLPFLPSEFRYEVIPDAEKQFRTVSALLARPDVERIYVCTDSGREGEYIYRLVEMMSDPSVKEKDRRRVWIDSFTEDEIRRGIREAKPLSAYDHLSDSAYLRAKEDYLMGINFSRVLTLKYGGSIADYRNAKWSAVSVGRVMTCVLGMVVRREREIRAFVKQPFFRVLGTFDGIEGEWRVSPGSRYENSPKLYKENGFRERKDAEELIRAVKETAASTTAGKGPQDLAAGQNGSAASDAAGASGLQAKVESVTRKQEKKNPPLLYNLAELQNDCSRLFHISPDQTLKIAQELYEKKLTTYPRTDARVLSSAVAAEINKNLSGLTKVGHVAEYASEVLAGDAWKKIGRSRYTDDKAITDHYAIIPTGSGLGALRSLGDLASKVYELICRRFLSVFYPPAVYSKTQAVLLCGGERFYVSERRLLEPGYLKVAGRGENDSTAAPVLADLKKNMVLSVESLDIREGETTPPKRYTSGSMILAMENAGQLIEDDTLREQIKGAGIGTSATRADILAKLVKIGYLQLNKKTQVITPELLGEMVFDVVEQSIRQLLNPELTASWEKGLTGVAAGTITTEEYMQKLEAFVAYRTNAVRQMNNQSSMRVYYDRAAQYYKKAAASSGKTGTRRRSTKAKQTPKA
ncbi:MAG: DNA topoisomerase [Lachnospiraceae bacterium]|nr:DNA topoisomerase [Lachnospiraceae bacterium]